MRAELGKEPGENESAHDIDGGASIIQERASCNEDDKYSVEVHNMSEKI